MKPSFLLLLLCFCFFYSFGQSSTDTIEVRKSFWHGSRNFVNGKKLLPIEASALLLSVPESKAEFLKARKSYLRGILVWVAGATVAVIGITHKPKASAPMMFAGAAITTFTIPFIVHTKKHISKSIHLYNEHVRNTRK